MYVIGIDVGGTFTDCVVIDAQGHATMDKAFTTPGNLAEGILGALTNVCNSLDKDLANLLDETRIFALGTTSITNRVVARLGARVGLVTTRGHEDAVLIGRVLARTEGLRENQLYDISAWRKPKPLLERRAIKGVTERVDCKGQEIVPLKREEVEQIVQELRQLGVNSVAVVFLWSFLNPRHEQQAKKIITELSPDLPVSLSCEVSPTLGEYERANTAILNAFLAPAARDDLGAIEKNLQQKGLRSRILIMQSNGGLAWSEEVQSMPVRALAAGPVGGVMGAAKLSSAMGQGGVICTDMGGTSFDVGLVVEGHPRFSNETVVERHRIRVPTVEVTSIGAGGGSLAYVDAVTMELRVGPQSAGSVPGPVCYRRGGSDPTVTDADVVLGRIDPTSFFGGRNLLDKQAALDAIRRKIAEPLGLDSIQAAQGITAIVDARMADLIKTLTIEKGHDPRNFMLFAYGGAGPTHVGAYASQIGVKSVVIPLFASVFSAFGIATSDFRRHYSRAQPMQSPFDSAQIRSSLEELEATVRSDWVNADLRPEDASYLWFADMRFRYQGHEIRVAVPRQEGEEIGRLLAERFIGLYEQAFGSGSAGRKLITEILTFHVLSVAPAAAIGLSRVAAEQRGRPPTPAGVRKVYFDNAFEETPVYEVKSLSVGSSIKGPAIIEAQNTTIVVHPEQSAHLDEYLNVLLEV